MAIILEFTYWSTLINIILQAYFSNLTTTCVLRHKLFDFNFISSNIVLHINPLTLSKSFAKDVYNFSQQDDFFNGNGVFYDDLIKKYVAAIEQANCEVAYMTNVLISLMDYIANHLYEIALNAHNVDYMAKWTISGMDYTRRALYYSNDNGFVAFQDDIPKFAKMFRKASLYSVWCSLRTRFLFVYTEEYQEEDYFREKLFKEQSNILIVQAEFMNSSQFTLQTNKFVGSIFLKPEELVYLSTFYALNSSFYPDIYLYPKNKLDDLQGREIIIAALDYRPFVAVDFKRLPQYYDHASDNPTHLVHIDGVEPRICHLFCEIHNCTIQFDTTEKEDWGITYGNYTGTGMLGMVMEGKADLSVGALFAWHPAYVVLDASTFMSRSGVTCLVPAPTRLTSWSLPLKPFQFTLWLAVILCLILEWLTLTIARRFEQSVEGSTNTWWPSLEFGYSTTLRLFISQGSDYVVNSHTVRTALFACYMIDIIITSVYGGGLASVLTLPTLGEAADTVERLYRHNLLWSGNGLTWTESLKDDEGPIAKRLVNNFRVNSFEDIREKAKTENMGFTVERLAYGYVANLEFVTPESLRRLKIMKDDLYWGHTVALTKRLWALLPKFNNLVLAWRSAGFEKFWEWKITAEYLNVNQQYQVQASRYINFDFGPMVLGMDNFSGLILIWLVGMAVSIMAFFGELLLYYAKKKMFLK